MGTEPVGVADPGSDVAALVEWIECDEGEGSPERRIARIVEILMEQHPFAGDPCRIEHLGGCVNYWPLVRERAYWCPSCRDRALRERCDRVARGDAE